MHTTSRILPRLATFTAALFCALHARAAEPVLQLKDNDVWVMAGDSITAQRLHTNYIEAFFRTRNPGMQIGRAHV